MPQTDRQAEKLKKAVFALKQQKIQDFWQNFMFSDIRRTKHKSGPIYTNLSILYAN